MIDRRALSLGHATALAACALLWARPLHADEPPARSAAPETKTLAASAATSMARIRQGHVAVRLLDGRVFVAGGRPGDAATTAEIFDPVAGMWAKAAPMPHGHDWPVASIMCDGRVLVTGAYSKDPQPADVYDPATDTWGDLGETELGHLYGAATLLNDCRVLLSGGYSANTRSEVYDPSTGLFKITSPMHSERFFHTATLLSDGRVLAAGGGVDVQLTWQTYPTADVFDPATNKWTAVEDMQQARRAHTATLLPDGKVLVAGGLTGGKNNDVGGPTPISTAELFDPVTGAWTTAPTTLITPRGAHTAAITPSGAVLLFGGLDATGSATNRVEGYFGGAFFALDPLLADRFEHASASLTDGRVLLMGGVHQATTEIFDLTPLAAACSLDIECATGHCADGVCCESSCGAGCRRCDLPGREGTCSRACASATHALACPDGGDACENAACVEVSCSPLRCDQEAGACRAACASVEDCAPGFACDFDGRCAPPPDVSSSDAEACSASAEGRSGAAPLGALAALALASIARRAHTRRRGRSC